MKKIFSLALVITLIGCSGDKSGNPADLLAWLDQPSEDGYYETGQEITIQAHARGKQGEGIIAIEFWVNETLYEKVPTNPQLALVEAGSTWMPTQPGDYKIEAKAISQTGAVSKPAILGISVFGNAQVAVFVPDLITVTATITLTPRLTFTPSNTPTLTPTRTPTLTVTRTPTLTQTQPPPAANRNPNTPSNVSPATNTGVPLGSAPKLCGQHNGDPDGDAITAYYFVVNGEKSWESGWVTTSCVNMPANAADVPGTYYWLVRVSDARGGVTASATWYFVVRAAVNNPPNKPSNVSPASNSIFAVGTAPKLCAQDHGDPDGETVADYRFELTDGSKVLYDSGWGPFSCVTTRGDFINRPGAYYWHAKVNDRKGAESAWGPTWNIIIKDQNNAPTNVTATRSGNFVTISWTLVPNAYQYLIEVQVCKGELFISDSVVAYTSPETMEDSPTCMNTTSSGTIKACFDRGCNESSGPVIIPWP